MMRLQRDRIGLRLREFQIRQNIFDFSALVVADAAHHVVLQVVAAHRFFNLPRLRIGAVQNRDLAIRILAPNFVGGIGDEKRFVFGVLRGIDGDLVAFVGFRPEPLAFALQIIRDHDAGGFENIFRRAVILFKPNDFRVGKVFFEIENIANIGAAPAIDGLIFVAHHADVVVPLREQAHQLVLAAIGVLILVDHDVAEAAIPRVAGCLIVREQADGFEQQIVEIERVGLPQRLFVFFVNGGDAGHARIGSASVEILRRFLQALGLADLRHGRAVRNRLVVEAHALVRGFDDGELIFIVVDGKLPCEARANLRQSVAVTPQQSHAERMERGNHRRGRKLQAFEMRFHARAHFTRGLVGESDRQNREWRHLIRGDDVRDAVRDDARLAAARSGKDQEWSFGSSDGFTLRGIETGKKIHLNSIFAGVFPH